MQQPDLFLQGHLLNQFLDTFPICTFSLSVTCELAAAAFKNSPQAITPIIFFISFLFIGLLLRLNRYRRLG